MKWMLFFLFVLSSNVFAHEINLSASHVSLRRQHSSGRQALVDSFIDLNDHQRLRLGAQYLERFDLYERLFLVGFEHKFESFYVNANAEYGHNGRILPHQRYSIGSGQAFLPGLSFYEELRTAEYTGLRLDEVLLNMEIEKIQSIIFVPMVRLGKAHFKSPSGDKNLFGYGLKAIYYKENIGQVWVGVFKGQEPAQIVLGRFNEILKSTSVSAGVKYEWNESLSSGLSIEHTDYSLINNQFITTTLSTSWRF